MDNNFNTPAPSDSTAQINAPLKSTPKPGRKNSLILAAAILFVLISATVTELLLLTQAANNPSGSPQLKGTAGVTVVPTTLDEIARDSAWCGAFQLVWNDMKNEMVGDDVVFYPQLQEVVNLNKGTFTASMLSSDYYYKTYGLKTLKLKNQIERAIKDKFNETSAVLDGIDWSNNTLDNPDDPDVRRFLFYAMLKRKFDYQYKLNKLDNQKFGDYENVAYFGTKHVRSEAYDQFKALYFNSKDDFAIQITTDKQDNEVIFVKNPQGTTFAEIYRNMNSKAASYKGSRSFQVSDRYIDDFKAPNLTLNVKKNYVELTRNKFRISKSPDGRFAWMGEIMAAIQTIQFQLDEKGGSIKSEAGIEGLGKGFALLERERPEPEYRNFYLDDTFAVFLRESGKTQPYFAARVNDITKFQQ